MPENIAKLVQAAPAFTATANGEAVHEYFEQNKEAEGVVVIDGGKPAGILMRNDFYQKIGSKFGYSIYMKRDVTLLMKKEITCVETNCDMAAFGLIAMNRNQDCIYDFIVALDGGNYAGIVSISEFLIAMSQARERENAAIRNLLDHAGQGFLFFGADLLISEEYSKECDGIFGFSVGKKDFLEIMREYVDKDTLMFMQNVFQQVFRQADKTRNKAYLSILPAEIRIDGKYIRLEYKMITHEGKKSVMTILTDITEKKELEIKNAEEKNNIRLVIRAISNKQEVIQAMEDLRELIEQEAPRLINSGGELKEILQQIFRAVHTMKGDFSFNYLHHTAAGLHQLEDTLGRMLKNAETIKPEDVREFLRAIDCRQLLQQDLAIITEVLGEQYLDNDDYYTVSRQRLQEIENKVREFFPDEKRSMILKLLESMFYANIKDIIQDYDGYIQILGQRFGKNIGGIKISGEDVYISKERYVSFLKSLVHVFRNMADHGIEEPEERAFLGKEEQGEISCTVEKLADRFILVLADDGRGLDGTAIRRKAIEKGIVTAQELAGLSEQQIMEMIFLDDFSTKDTIDMYSGRGVGLAAVRSVLEELGGNVMVESVKGRYTRFKLSVPLFQA